jgi:hypothetical protein
MPSAGVAMAIANASAERVDAKEFSLPVVTYVFLTK